MRLIETVVRPEEFHEILSFSPTLHSDPWIGETIWIEAFDCDAFFVEPEGVVTAGRVVEEEVAILGRIPPELVVFVEDVARGFAYS